MKFKYLSLALPFIFVACSSCGNQESTEDTSDETTEEVVEEEVEDEVEEMTAVYFVNLKNGDEVNSPVVVEMGINGMEIEPAGEVRDGFGHHHLVVDGTFVPFGETIPMHETSFHYGKGQTADTVELAPGSHTLTLQFGDGLHSSLGESFSKTITVTVVE
jgi:hypothetical protein